MKPLTLDLLPERIAKRIVIDAETGCWNWIGARFHYGHVWDGTRATYTHRVVWTLLVGPIPDGLHVDHAVCGNKFCCFPDHLELVSPAENTRRWAASRTHCRHGHELTPENTYLRKSRTWSRRCRTCKNEQQTARNARLAALKVAS